MSARRVFHPGTKAVRTEQDVRDEAGDSHPHVDDLSHANTGEQTEQTQQTESIVSPQTEVEEKPTSQKSTPRKPRSHSPSGGFSDKWWQDQRPPHWG